MLHFNLFFTLLLSLPFLSNLVTASNDLLGDRNPMGGSVINLDTRDLRPRAKDPELGTDCGGIAGCSTTDWGCDCGFTDGSWIPKDGGDDGGDDGGGGGKQCLKTGGESCCVLYCLFHPFHLASSLWKRNDLNGC